MAKIININDPKRLQTEIININDPKRLQTEFEKLIAKVFEPKISLVQYRVYLDGGFTNSHGYDHDNVINQLPTRWVYMLAKVLDKKKMRWLERFLLRHDKTERQEAVKICPSRECGSFALNGALSIFGGNKFNPIDIQVFDSTALQKAERFAREYEQLSGKEAAIYSIN